MISIIISSYKEFYFQQVSYSINETIGVPYEIIKIYNPNVYSITKAYNLGAEKAKFDILCFIHEDVKFYSKDWGKNLLTHFKNISNLGLIGVAGSTEKLPVPSGWGNPDKNKNKIHILQHNKKGNSYKISSFNGQDIDFVEVIDGVFIATKKSIWKELPFDENITGFHLYDIDFSLQISQKYKVAIAYDVLIEHFSHGNFSDDWIDATIKYHKNKSKAHLFKVPKNTYPIIRRPYYVLLVNSKASFKSKLLYIKNLGVDMRSLLAIGLFLFPQIGKFLIRNFVKYKKLLNIKRIRYKKYFLSSVAP